jgi:hypothetical protein
MRQEKAHLKKKGNLLGWFGTLPRGRPPKVDENGNIVVNPKLLSKKDHDDANAKKRKHQELTPLSGISNGCTKKTKATRTNWSLEENFPCLRDAVLSKINADDDDNVSGAIISRKTLSDHVANFKRASVKFNIPVEAVTCDMIFCIHEWKRLLCEDDVSFLGDCIRMRDNANTGMSRHEVIHLIMELAQTNDFTKCENHWHYLVRNHKVPGLKRGGKVTAAQSTTTKRSQIRVEQQLRWHTTVENALAEQRRLNLPTEEFDKVCDSFFGNLDESCFMTNSDGKVKVVASNEKRKTEKITDDSRQSITSVRVGMASGEEGPYIFLAKGQEIGRDFS